MVGCLSAACDDDLYLTEDDLRHLGREGERIAYKDLSEDEAARLYAAYETGNSDTDNRLTLLPAEVWEFSPALRQIRRAALARQVSPDVVLHAVLVIIASQVHHLSRVATGKGFSVLSYYLIAVGQSGAGKTEALSCARELLSGWLTDRFAITGDDGYIDLPLGSGEGLIEAFMGRKTVPKLDESNRPVHDKAGTPVQEEIRAQVRHNALFHTDEGRMLLAVDARKGATIMSVLCEMWSGSVAGQTNAEVTRTRKISAGTYVVGLLLGFQPATIDALFEDTAGGAPQRFAFADTEHPDITADEIEWPGGLALDVPVAPLSITLPAHLRRQVREHQAARARGEGAGSPLDGHRMLLTCRAAVLLALLHDEREVSDPYWELAGTLIDTSCRLRDHLAARVERQVAEQARRREETAVRTQVTAATKVADASRVRRAADRIVRAVEAEGGELSYGRAKNALRADARDAAELAISLAIADGRLVAEDRAATGARGPRRVTFLRLRTGEEEE